MDEKNTIVLCSANAAEWLERPTVTLLNQQCDDVLPEPLCNAIGRFVAEGRVSVSLPATVTIGTQGFDCFFRNAGDRSIVECIRPEQASENLYDVLLASHEIISLITPTTGLRQVSELVAQQIQKVTGYSRVMIYRFDDQYNGHVYAEAVTDNQASFLDLHYPHTDIPPQARDLYLRNLIRSIPDVHYTPVPVLTLQPELAQPEAVDMSQVHLRSVSPIHIQYLKNMGVAATLTISLVKGGKLWGLVACHHHQPRHLSFARQSNALMLAQILSAQLVAQETAETYKLVAELEEPLQQLSSVLSNGHAFTETAFKQSHDIRKAVGATGAALLLGEHIWRNGLLPADEHLRQLDHFISNKPLGWHTCKLSEYLPGVKAFAGEGAGILAYRLPSSPAPATLVFFRAAKNRVITWAGQKDDQSGPSQLTPRSSFAAWQEVVEGESIPWEQPAVAAGMRLMYALQDNLVRSHLQEEELQMRRLNEQLVKANKELENIHWISTHDLKEPLRKIQMFASMIDKGEGELSVQQVQSSIERIKSASTRMQRLIDDLLLYGKMTSGGLAMEPVRLDDVLEDAQKAFELELSQGVLQLQVAPLPTVKGNPFQLQQLFINLIGNSVKFKQPDKAVNVTLQAHDADGFHHIVLCDDGQGFPSDMSEKIFQIFQRGHTANVAQGTGVGLSICKKIMENHNGTIVAKGAVGQGACFYMRFPISAQ